MAQTIGGVITALKAACDTLYASVLDESGSPAQVVLSRPGQYQANYIVAVGTAVRQDPITRPTMGPGRSRETPAQIDIVFSIYVPGGEEAQVPAIDRALSMQGQLETYLRTSPNETLGGACRDAVVSRAELVPETAYSTFDDPNIAPVPTGRIADNTVTVTAFIRY